MRGLARVRATHPSLPRWASIALALGTLFVATAAAGAVHPMAQPYSSASAGNVEVTFPSAYPEVELSEAGNQTIVASLSVEQILEATPSATSPQVVAVALPSNIVVTSGGGSGGSPVLPFTLTAALTVYPSNAGLWQGPGDLVQADGAPLGTANLSIAYSLTPSSAPSQGVTTHWSVSGWPWIASSDLLGLQFGMSMPLTRGVVACTGPTDSVEHPGCSGTGLSDGSAVWSPEVRGIQGSTPSGPTSLVSWDAGFHSSLGAGGPVSVGVLTPDPSQGQLLVAAPVGGASQVSDNVSFALLPALPELAVPLVLHGEWTWYLTGLAASVGAGLAGVLAFQRSQRRIEREL